MLARNLIAAAGNAGVAGNPYWVNAFSDAGWTDTGAFAGSAVDSSGNIYCAGAYREAAGSQPNHAFLVKYAPDGSVTWQRRLYDGTNSTRFTHVAVDTSGNVITCGRYIYNSGATVVALVAKYNSAGTLQWQRTLNDGGDLVFAQAVATDSSGNVYVAGYTLNDGSGTVVKYNSSGTLQWQRYLFQSLNNIEFNAIATDGSSVYAAGSNNTQAIIKKLQAADGQSLFVETLDAGFGNSQFLGLTLDSSNNPIACGYYRDAIGDNPYWTVKLNTSLVAQWQSILNVGVNSGFYGVAAGASGDVYVAGAGEISSVYSGVLAKYNSSGTLQWQRSLRQGGGDEFPYFIGLSRSSAGVLYPVGTTEFELNPTAFAFPDDGTKTGTYGDFIYAASSLTSAAGIGAQDTPSVSVGDYTYTSSTSTLTDAATTFTATKTNI